MNSPRSPQTPLSSELKQIITDRNVLSMRSRMRVLNSMNETNQRTHEEKERQLRSQAIQEILTTEVTYLRQLEIMMEYFIQPIFDKKLLDHMLLLTLSENIKTLYNVSGELIKELRHDPQNIAKAFHRLAPFFKLYSVYAYDYQQVWSLLQATQDSDPVFKDFISQQETRPEVSRKLASLLITPIQRVPRYKLLLKEVLQHTPNRHKEYNLLQACLVEIEKAAKHIDSLVAENEETQKLLKLQKCIINPINLVKPGRKLIKQGALMRVSRKGHSAYRRYFVLLSDTLLYCKGDPDNSLTVCCVLPLNKCKVESVLSGGLFRVTCLDETLLLYSEKNDSNTWIESIQNSIKKYAECRQTLRKESSSRQPLRHHRVKFFPSENIPAPSTKRKRFEDEEVVALDASRIMYFKTDNEADEENQNKCFFLLKKLKRLKKDDSKDMECYLENVQSQLQYNYVDNKLLDNRPELDFTRSNVIKMTGTRKGNIPTELNRIQASDFQGKTTSALRAVGDFFSYVSSSIRQAFTFR